MIERDEYQVPADAIEALARRLLPTSALTSRARRARRLSTNGSRGRTPKHSRHRQRKSWRADNHGVGGSNPAFRFFAQVSYAPFGKIKRPHGAKQTTTVGLELEPFFVSMRGFGRSSQQAYSSFRRAENIACQD